MGIVKGHLLFLSDFDRNLELHLRVVAQDLLLQSRYAYSLLTVHGWLEIERGEDKARSSGRRSVGSMRGCRLLDVVKRI